MERNSIDVFEHGTIYVTSLREELFNQEGKRAKISEAEFKALQRYHSNVSSDFFDISHRKIKLKNYVGLLRVGALNINVLPKIDKSENDTTKWHDVLIQMIRYTQNFRSKKSLMALMRTSDVSILDLYIYEFYCEVEEILRKGQRKSYSFKQENISCVKGKILFGRDVLINAADRSKTFCQFQIYSTDTLLNHILRLGVKMSLQMTNNFALKEIGEALLERLPETQHRKIDKKVFERMKFNRNNSYYINAINLAKIIILETGPDLHLGQENIISFLFDMNQLFEEFIFKIARKEFSDSRYNVHRDGMLFWERKHIKPDIVIEDSEDDKVVVLDTKWKLPEDLKPSDADLKQIFVYNHYYGSNVSYLLYPSSEEKFTTDSHIIAGDFEDYKQNGEFVNNSCYLGFIPITKKGQLDILGAQDVLRAVYAKAKMAS